MTATDYAFNSTGTPTTGMYPFESLHSEPAASTRYAHKHDIVHFTVDQHFVASNTYIRTGMCRRISMYIIYT